MILSKQTIQVLQNFQTINPSIVIREGGVLRTMSSTETVFAKAVVPDRFPRSISIYDLSKFLGILSLTKEDSEIDFQAKSLIISQGDSTIKYAYCPEELIDSPPEGKDIKIKNVVVSFQLNNDVWQQVTRAMHVLGFQEVAFCGTDGVLSVEALSTRNDSSDTFSTVLGETNLEFQCVIDADKMRLIPDDYTVEITSQNQSHLAHFRGSVAEYWIAISTKSWFK
jgi:hypothetical protein